MNKILYLNQTEVIDLLDMAETLKVVEEAYRQHGLGKVQMPPKLYLTFKNHNGDLRTMPAYLEEQDIAGVKIVNVHPNNRAKGLPTVMALIVLNDTETGAPIAIMDGSCITAMRTGAGGGVAAKYLSRKDSKVVGLVGAGLQAETQLEAIMLVRKIETVKVYDLYNESAIKFKKKMEEKTGLKIVVVSTIKDACDCDILVTTTPSREPIVMDEWIKSGTHINAIGADAPGKEELDPEILKRAKVVVDDIPQASHSGEINVPLSKKLIELSDIYCELGEVIIGKKKARTSDSDITVYDSTGLGILDIATANLVLEKARKKGIGIELER